MNGNNKEKIKNIVARHFRSLPLAADLPRLVKHIRIFDKTSVLFPTSTSGEATIADNLFEIVRILSKLLCGEQQEKLVQQTFPKYFQLTQEKPKVVVEKQATQPPSLKHEGLDKLQDVRLREALSFLPEAFVGTESKAVYLFKLDRPTSQVTVYISPSGVLLKEGDPKDKENVDCTINCSSAVMIAILNGSLDPAVALRGGVLIVDNLAKLMVFGRAFQLDRKAFEEFKKKQALSNPIMELPAQQQDNTALGKALCSYFSEVLGDDNKVVKLAKAFTSATISPAIIELKMALGTSFMTKDVQGSWKFDILFGEEKIYVRTRKSEQDLKNRFNYTWELELAYNSTTIECADVNLRIISLNVRQELFAPDHQDQVKKILGIYDKPVLSPVENKSPEPFKRFGRTLLNSLISSPKDDRIKLEIYPNGDRYEGTMNNKGQRHGKGVYSTTSGDIYIGSYVENEKSGYGVYTMKDGTTYKGEWENGRPNGTGTYIFENGDIYTGEFKDDMFHGNGNWSSRDGSTYQGQFKDGKRDGYGVLFSRGCTYDGEWNNGVFCGEGIYIYSNGDMYEGSFKDGKFNGFGRYYVKASDQYIEGLFQDGKPVNTPVETKKQVKIDKQETEFQQWKEENSKKIEERRKFLKARSSSSLLDITF